MADEYPDIPHNDPNMIDAITSAEQLLMFDEDHDPLMLDSFINDMDDDVGDYGTTHFSGIQLEENMSNEEQTNCIGLQPNSTFGNSIRIPVWPVPISPYSCSCCQTLREFWHINGNRVLKLEIHGRLGVISHAVLDRYTIDMASENHEYHMFDFCQESISSVKQFLVEYCNDRKCEGYIMLQDPLSAFYNALCIELHSEISPVSTVSHHQTSTEDRQNNLEEGMNQPDGDGNGVRPSKSYKSLATEDRQNNLEEGMNQPDGDGNGVRPSTSYKSQRERTGKMKFKDVAAFFHLPIDQACEKLNICASALKHICRKEKKSRWPYRKINSNQRKIKTKMDSLNKIEDPNDRARVLMEIQELEQDLAKCYQPDVS